MKIVFVVPEISKTGGMRIIFEYANRLTKESHDVTVISPIIPFNAFMGEISLFYLNYRLKYASKFLAGKIEKPEKLFDINFKIKYIPFAANFFLPEADVYIATSWTTSYLVNKTNCDKKFYFVQDYETWLGNLEAIDNSYKLKLKKIVVSTYLKNLLKDKFNEDSEIILNGIDFKTFDNIEKSKYEVRNILFMDHSLKNKNTADAITLAEIIHNKYPKINFICFGREKYSNIPDFVDFHINPNDNEIKSLYKNADIYLYTSLYEGFALPPAEAMACKCAVVGYNTGALPDYSINNETALLCEAGNINKLIQNVEILIRNPEILEKISLSAYEHIRAKLNWNSAFSNFKKIIFS